MDNTHEVSGGCICGAVKFTAKSASTDVGACHCSMCRKWGGGPFLGVDCKNEIEFSGEQHIKSFSSSEWAERGFCNQCGTHLFYKLKKSEQYIVPVGIIDTNADFHFDHQIFIEEKPEFYAFSNETKNMTGEEVFAAFGAN